MTDTNHTTPRPETRHDDTPRFDMFDYPEVLRRTLNVVSSDHYGYTRSEKETENWWDSVFSANGLQTKLPVFHDVAVGG